MARSLTNVLLDWWPCTESPACGLLRAQIPCDNGKPVHEPSLELGDKMLSAAVGSGRELTNSKFLNFWWTDQDDIWMKHMAAEYTSSNNLCTKTAGLLKYAYSEILQIPSQSITQNTQVRLTRSHLSWSFGVWAWKQHCCCTLRSPDTQRKQKHQRGKSANTVGVALLNSELHAAHTRGTEFEKLSVEAVNTRRCYFDGLLPASDAHALHVLFVTSSN